MTEEFNLSKKFILDACCGVKYMWYNKNHPNVIYNDIRQEEKGFIPFNNTKNLSVNPDVIMDFRKLDFPDKSFKLVVFEPPHLSSLGKNSKFRKIYGALDKETWKEDIRKGFEECLRVLDDYGILEFKWSDYEIKFKEVLALFSIQPLFGNTTNYKATSKTKWFCFMKIPKEIKKEHEKK